MSQPMHKYKVTYRWYNGPTSTDTTVEMEGSNPFQAFERFRKDNPLPIIWMSQLIKIERQS